jgi:hypothetical protein
VNADDDYLASCLAVTLAKLAIKAKKRLCLSYKAISVDSILIMCSMLKERTIQKEQITKKARRMDQDSLQRV